MIRYHGKRKAGILRLAGVADQVKRPVLFAREFITNFDHPSSHPYRRHDRSYPALLRCMNGTGVGAGYLKHPTAYRFPRPGTP